MHQRFTNAHLIGFIPEFFSDHDPRPAREQFDENYQHGGGFYEIENFSLLNLGQVGGAELHYPGDPALCEISRGYLREELLLVFDAEILVIVQPDGSFVATRCN